MRAAGYAPAVGFIHTGKPLSFVYDVADIYKFDTVVPIAFKIAARTRDLLGIDIPPRLAFGADLIPSLKHRVWSG